MQIVMWSVLLFEYTCTLWRADIPATKSQPSREQLRLIANEITNDKVGVAVCMLWVWPVSLYAHTII